MLCICICICKFEFEFGNKIHSFIQTAKVKANLDYPIKSYEVLVNFLYATLLCGTVPISLISEQYNWNCTQISRNVHFS